MAENIELLPAYTKESFDVQMLESLELSASNTGIVSSQQDFTENEFITLHNYAVGEGLIPEEMTLNDIQVSACNVGGVLQLGFTSFTNEPNQRITFSACEDLKVCNPDVDTLSVSKKYQNGRNITELLTNGIVGNQMDSQFLFFMYDLLQKYGKKFLVSKESIL